MFDGVRKGGADTSGANRMRPQGSEGCPAWYTSAAQNAVGSARTMVIDHGVALDFLSMPRLARFGDNSNMEANNLGTLLERIIICLDRFSWRAPPIVSLGPSETIARFRQAQVDSFVVPGRGPIFVTIRTP